MGKQDKRDNVDSIEPSRLRIAIVNPDRCKPKKCRQECKRNCPVVRTGKLCIQVEPTSKLAWISESLCIGCGICVKKCPFEAISIINLPKDLGKQVTHRFGPNTFKLHRLPQPRPGQVLGLVGTNGIGKSTTLKILAGKLKPNLGVFDKPPEWQEILSHFRGSELQNYFTRILENSLKPMIKPQNVDAIPKQAKGCLKEIITKRDKLNRAPALIEGLDLGHLLNRNIEDLSGGELQRVAICIVALHDSDVFMFDEPSSYLDIRQRVRAARLIRECIRHDNYIIVVEHDLSVLDYLSDYLCCLWGKAGVYGVVTTPFSVKEGINVFLDGFIPTENLRFRDESLNFRINTDIDAMSDDVERIHYYQYTDMVKNFGGFKLNVAAGNFNDSEIMVLLGQNGTGKSTFIKMIAGLLKADEGTGGDIESLRVSYKPQTIVPKYQGTVRSLFYSKIRESFDNVQFQSDVVKPMQIENIMDQNVQYLSGGELQRVSLILALGKSADIYLIDEPSAYLDSEQRIVTARVIKRYVLHAKKTAFVVEHDFTMATYLANRVIVFEGDPGVACRAGPPETLLTGMNRFLAFLDITFRRDPNNFRPRINKLDSVLDREQKVSGNYFLLED